MEVRGLRGHLLVLPRGRTQPLPKQCSRQWWLNARKPRKHYTTRTAESVNPLENTEVPPENEKPDAHNHQTQCQRQDRFQAIHPLLNVIIQRLFVNRHFGFPNDEDQNSPQTCQAPAASTKTKAARSRFSRRRRACRSGVKGNQVLETLGKCNCC